MRADSRVKTCYAHDVCCLKVYWDILELRMIGGAWFKTNKRKYFFPEQELASGINC